MPPKPKYQVGEEILCLDTVSGLSYPAKIVKIVKEGRETVYRVHYQGWHVKHDEDVRERDTSSRFKELTQESQEQAKDEIKEARRKAQKPSKRKSVASGALNTPAAKATPKTEVPRTRAVKTPAKQAPSTRTPGTRTSVVRSSVATSSPPKTPAPKISAARILVPMTPTPARLPLKRKAEDSPAVRGSQSKTPSTAGRVSRSKSDVDMKVETKPSIPELDLPFKLIQVLKEDEENSHGLQTESKFSVDKIISTYVERCQADPTEDGYVLLAEALKDVFDEVAGTLLRQHEADCHRRLASPMSKHCGFVHIVRLLAHFEALEDLGLWPPIKENQLRKFFKDFAYFLAEHRGQFYKPDQDRRRLRQAAYGL